jgi:hypothetical protein
METEASSKSIGAGISLKPELRRRAADLAAKRGFPSLSSFVSVLLSDELNKFNYLLHETSGNISAQPHSGPVVLKPHKQSAGGSWKAPATKETRYKPKRRAS